MLILHAVRARGGRKEVIGCKWFIQKDTSAQRNETLACGGDFDRTAVLGAEDIQHDTVIFSTTNPPRSPLTHRCGKDFLLCVKRTRRLGIHPEVDQNRRLPDIPA